MNAPEMRALAAAPDNSDRPIDMFTARGFELACRVAKAFASSTAVPDQFRGQIEKKNGDGTFEWVENPAALGNCIVAIEVARAVGTSIASVMQNADTIHGKLRWSSKFVIAAINASGRFTPLQFDFVPRGRITAKYREKGSWNNQKRKFDYTEKTVEIDDVMCTAWAYAKDHGSTTTRKVMGAPVSMKMAVEEGWYAKDGSKWQGEMATLMLTYRAGTFFGNIHAPDIVMGMGTPAEVERDVIDITPESPAEQPPPAPAPATPPRKQRTEPDATPSSQAAEPALREAVQAAETELDRMVDDVVAHAEELGQGSDQPAEPNPARVDEQPAPGPTDSAPLAPPAAGSPAPGAFMATEGERGSLLTKARNKNWLVHVLLQGNLSDARAAAINHQTLEGLTKEEFKLLRAALA